MTHGARTQCDPRGKTLGSENMDEGGQDSASGGDAPGPPRGPRGTVICWGLGPTRAPTPPRAMSQAWPSFLEQMPGTVASCTLLRLGRPLRPWCLSRGRPMLGACVTGPPMPIRAPPSWSPPATAPDEHLRPHGHRKVSGGPHPHQVHTHVAQLSPKTRGRPRAGGLPPQGQPHPQLRSHRGGHHPACGLVGPRGPACGHSSWVTRGHTKPLLPQVQGGSAQGSREVSGSGNQGPALPVLGGLPVWGP